MNSTILVLALCSVVFFSPHLASAQGEAALPFLLIPSSPEGNGMGGIVGTTPTDNPLGILENPGQLGLTSLDHFFLGGLYPSSTAWLPGFNQPDINYSANAFSAGLNLNRVIAIPLGLSVGFAYSHIDHNLGLFAITGQDPTVLGTFTSEEHSNNWSVGIGADYYVRLGLGY